MIEPAAALVHDVERRINEIRDVITGIQDRRRVAALAALDGEPAAVAKREALRAEEAQAQLVSDDLTSALTAALTLAEAAHVEAGQDADRGRHERAGRVAALRVAAATRVDRLTGELAAAMLVHDSLAQLSHGLTSRAMGDMAMQLVTKPCSDCVLGQLVRHQAIPREHLPSDHYGEMGLVHLVAEGALRHLAMLETYKPAPAQRRRRL